MRLKYGKLKQLIRELYCKYCDDDHDHDGKEPFTHDDNDAELNGCHWNDPQPPDYKYKKLRNIP